MSTVCVARRRIVGMGDSLTAQGRFISHLMQVIFVGTGGLWAGINKGISGNRTDQMLARFDADVLSYSPTYVAIWGGINDIAQGVEVATIESNLAAMYAAAQGAGIPVIAVQISPCKGYTSWSTTWQTKIDAVNAWLAAGPANVNVVALAYAALEDPQNADQLLLAYDGGDHLHLHDNGHDVVSQVAYDAGL